MPLPEQMEPIQTNINHQLTILHQMQETNQEIIKQQQFAAQSLKSFLNPEEPDPLTSLNKLPPFMSTYIEPTLPPLPVALPRHLLVQREVRRLRDLKRQCKEQLGVLDKKGRGRADSVELWEQVLQQQRLRGDGEKIKQAELLIDCEKQLRDF